MNSRQYNAPKVLFITLITDETFGAIIMKINHTYYVPDIFKQGS